MRKPTPHPTDTEFSILRALWDLGPSTVRQVFEVLSADREDLAYPAVLRMMLTMADKGLLTRDDSNRSHVFAAAQPRQEVQASLIDDLLGRVFGGSTLELLSAALAKRKMDPDEKQQVDRLLARATQEKR